MINSNPLETIINNLPFGELALAMYTSLCVLIIIKFSFGNTTKEDREIDRKTEIEKELIARLELDKALLHKLKRIGAFGPIEQKKK